MAPKDLDTDEKFENYLLNIIRCLVVKDSKWCQYQDVDTQCDDKKFVSLKNQIWKTVCGKGFPTTPKGRGSTTKKLGFEQIETKKPETPKKIHKDVLMNSPQKPISFAGSTVSM